MTIAPTATLILIRGIAVPTPLGGAFFDRMEPGIIEGFD